MNLKKLIKSRRGVAIELAIGVMFLLMAFTIMLLSTAGLQNSHRNNDYKEFNERIEINNVGEYVLANPTQTNIIVNDIHYTVKINNNKYEIYRGDSLTDFEGLEPVLTIELDGDKITSWK